MEFDFYLFQSVLSVSVFLILFYHNFSTGVHWILGAEGMHPKPISSDPLLFSLFFPRPRTTLTPFILPIILAGISISAPSRRVGFNFPARSEGPQGCDRPFRSSRWRWSVRRCPLHSRNFGPPQRYHLLPECFWSLRLYTAARHAPVG